MKGKWGTILFWGAVWGVSEATLGFLFHKAAVAIPGLPGLLLFPVAFLFMGRVWDETQDGSVIFLTACVAASVKFVDFLAHRRGRDSDRESRALDLAGRPVRCTCLPGLLEEGVEAGLPGFLPDGGWAGGRFSLRT